MHWFGLDNSNSTPYLFWSGIAGDFGILSVIGLVYRRHNCHQPGCWRLGKHPCDHFMYCAKHHPLVDA